MAFAPYASLAEFKAWVTLDDSIDDVLIEAELVSTTRWIDEHCNRHYWRDGVTGTEVARKFTTSDPGLLELGSFNDLVPGSVTALKTDEAGDGTFETTWTASDYELQPVNRPTGWPHTDIEAIGGRRFPVRAAGGTGSAYRVEITGIWGWPAVPDPVKEACKIQTNRSLKARFSPEGMAGIDTFGVAIRVPGQADPRAIEKLGPYRNLVLVA